MRFLVLLLALLAAPFPIAHAAPWGGHHGDGLVHVRLVTSAGPIVLALDARHAPKTVANFMKYVDDGRLDDTQFYRAARRKGDVRFGFIQGGIGQDARRILPSVPLEPTNRTGIHHVSGTISMAHGPDPDSAAGNFSIMVGDNPALDARGTFRGFAAFGHVVSGMDVVKRILALPSGGGSGPMKGQMIFQPVRILHADRLDGIAQPTGLPKPWTIIVRH